MMFLKKVLLNCLKLIQRKTLTCIPHRGRRPRHSTGCPRNYRKSVLQFCVFVLGRLRDLQYIFAVTYGAPSISWV